MNIILRLFLRTIHCPIYSMRTSHKLVFFVDASAPAQGNLIATAQIVFGPFFFLKRLMDTCNHTECYIVKLCSLHSAHPRGAVPWSGALTRSFTKCTCTRRGSTRPRGEHANSTQKGSAPAFVLWVDRAHNWATVLPCSLPLCAQCQVRREIVFFPDWCVKYLTLYPIQRLLDELDCRLSARSYKPTSVLALTDALEVESHLQPDYKICRKRQKAEELRLL